MVVQSPRYDHGHDVESRNCRDIKIPSDSDIGKVPSDSGIFGVPGSYGNSPGEVLGLIGPYGNRGVIFTHRMY